jgi:DNA-binding MarR family transcriptional regulator
MTKISLPTDNHPLRLVGQVFRTFSRIVDAPMRELGFAVGQMPVLVALRMNPSLPQSELARIAGVEQPSMAQLLARMERDGLIERTPDPDDGRSRRIVLTKRATTQMPKVKAVMEETSEGALAGFSANERALLGTMLARVAANLEKMQEAKERDA